MPAPVIDLSRVAPEHLEEAKAILAQYEALIAANPLHMFEPNPPEPETGYSFQAEFLKALTAIVASFCGNQSGKSTGGVVKVLCQVLPKEDLPDHLLPFKQFDAPCHGWILCPTEDKIFDSLKPAIEKWCPKHALKGGNWGKAFNGERMQLTFTRGSTIGFKTYKQDASTLGGATLHWVLYDEPPPRAHRDECATRLLQHNGPEWYVMTPLKANTPWIRREIWRNREAPHITVLKGSMHGNPWLDKQAVKRQLASYANDRWRRAREYGDFMDVAGQVYADIMRCVVEPQGPSYVRSLDQVWPIDPGIRNAAVICTGFDSQGRMIVYDEILIQNGTPSQYVEAIDQKLKRWGLRRDQVAFVIDPAARQRSQVTGDTVQTELIRLGIFTINGQRDREAGQQQLRDRMLHSRFQVFSTCMGILDEADEFAWEMDDDEDDIGPADDSPFHRLAAMRYGAMHRPFYPALEERAGERDLGAWVPGRAPSASEMRSPQKVPPLGFMQ